jgi:two-component system alkaline phosphatase synthesis response regulator PhoP
VAKILIIDDDELVRMALQSRLEKENFDVVTAGNGPEGLQLAGTEAPQLIILDLEMPELDGVEVLDRLRHDVLTWEIPVMVLSASGDPAKREETQRLGISRFLTKPFSPRELVTEVARVLRLV